LHGPDGIVFEENEEILPKEMLLKLLQVFGGNFSAIQIKRSFPLLLLQKQRVVVSRLQERVIHTLRFVGTLLGHFLRVAVWHVDYVHGVHLNSDGGHPVKFQFLILLVRLLIVFFQTGLVHIRFVATKYKTAR
jgi:hypothetical protein